MKGKRIIVSLVAATAIDLTCAGVAGIPTTAPTRPTRLFWVAADPNTDAPISVSVQ